MPASHTTHHSTSAILLAPRLAQAEEITLVELQKLLEGLHIDVLDTIVQRAAPLGSPHLIGKGKLAELTERAKELRQSLPAETELLLVVASDISPAEQRNLERAVELPVLDRSAVILRVFEERAQTPLARLEVALARARYELPRVRDDQSLGDKEGGGGRAARGNSNVELKKEGLRRSIADLEKRIKVAEQAKEVQERGRNEIWRAALVGYTNAGKSSLLSALSEKEIYVADELFATLSTTVRTLPQTTPPILVSDTVGFMRALPHELLRSFRSTLMEAVTAHLRLIVVDASDPSWPEQLAVSTDVLDDLGADRSSDLFILNKADRLSEDERRTLRELNPGALVMSAHVPADVANLRRIIVEHFDGLSTETTVVVPFSDGKTLSQLFEKTHVVSSVATPEGMSVTLRAPRAALERLGLGLGDGGAAEV